MKLSVVGCLVILCFLIGETTISNSYYGEGRIKSSCHDKELLFDSEWLSGGHGNDFEYYVYYGNRSTSWKDLILNGKLHYSATDAYCAKVNGGDCSSVEARLAADRICNERETVNLEDCVGRLEQSYHDRDYRSLSLTVAGKGPFHNPNAYNDYYTVQAELVLADGCKLNWKDTIGFYWCDDLDEDGHPEFELCCDEFGPEDEMCFDNHTFERYFD